MMDRVALAFGSVVGVGMSAASFALGQLGTISGDQVVVGLATYGPLGAMCLFLLVRQREKDREHAAERAEDRRETNAAIKELADSSDKGNETLAAILEHMRRQM